MGVGSDWYGHSAATRGFPALGHEPHQYVTFYVQVEDIVDCLQRIERAGGKKLVGPVPLPPNRQFAWFADPEGNMVGLAADLPQAKG